MVVGDSLVDGGTVSTCAGSLAQRTFRFGLCTCEALTLTHNLTLDSFLVAPDGGVINGRKNGSLGVDNGLAVIGSAPTLTVQGSVFVSDGGASFGKPAQIAGNFEVGTPVAGGGSAVGHDAYMGSTVSNLAVTNALHVPSAGNVGSGVTFASEIIEPVNIGDPCNCTGLIDVAGIVAAHQGLNDNANIGLVLDGGFADGGLDPATWATGTGPGTFDFPCGRYYLSGVTIAQSTTWTISGHTALLVNGDFAINQHLTITLNPGAELDLFIAGNFSNSLSSTIGNADQLSVAQTRIYVGGSQDINLSRGGSAFYMNLYAPLAKVVVSNPFSFYGAVFARAFDNQSNTSIHYSENVLQAGVECSQLDAGSPPVDAGTPPADGGSVTDAGSTSPDAGTTDAGPPPPQCTSCNDCGNQACINGQCGACTDNTQCCAPLVCQSGVCAVLNGLTAGPMCGAAEPGCPME